MRILIIEDDPQLGPFLQDALKSECFAVDLATDGENGSFLACTNDYDIVILDNSLPKKNGPQICKEIRAARKNSRVLSLSVESHIPKKVELLDCGADDYLTKPFSLEELVARVHALIRRTDTAPTPLLTIEDLTLDPKRHLVTRAGKEIKLTRKEFMLLEYLLRNQGSVVSRGAILEHVWEMNADIFSNTIETHVLTLRKKVDAGFGSKLIHTVSGSGYKISA